MFKKPGKPKNLKEKIPSPPVEKHCRRCGRTTQTECYRHAESRNIKFQSGGGIIGSKIDNDKTSWLCMECDSVLSQPLSKYANRQQLNQHEKEWNRLIDLSH